MNESEEVLDASALLCYLQGESGALLVKDALAQGCCISAVNWAEVLSKTADLGIPSRDLVADLTSRQLLGTALRIVPFSHQDAVLAGDLRPRTRQQGLSLGDRACLALGQRLQARVLTADRAWEGLEEDLRNLVQLIR